MAAARLGQVWPTRQSKLPADGPSQVAFGKSTPDRWNQRSRSLGQFLALTVLMGMLFLGPGCSTSWFNHDRLGADGPYGSARPSPMETARLLSNAHYYKLMGRPDAALKELEEAHHQDPNNLKVLDALAQNYQELGYFQRAQELYQKALAHHGANQALSNNLCFSYYLEGKLHKAESCFMETLARDPGNDAARNNLGLIWCREGKLAEARRLWQEAEGTEGAQRRLHQALAFLGKSTSASYAGLAEPAVRPTMTASQRPATPAKPAPAMASAPKAAVTPTPPVALQTPTKPMAPQSTLASQEQVAKLPASTKPAALASIAGQKPAPQAPALPANSKIAAKPPELMPASAPRPVMVQRPTPIIPATPAKPAMVVALAPKAAVTSPSPVAAPSQSTGEKAAKSAASPSLTPQERLQADIALQNGTRERFLAHQTRSLLSREGFKVAQIGNYFNFGAKATVIYYRPNEQKVAQVLNSEIFPKARIKPSNKLKHAIRIVLGHDLLHQPQFMARLTGKETVPITPAVIARQSETESTPQPVAAEKQEAPAAPVASARIETVSSAVHTGSGTSSVMLAAAMGAQRRSPVEADQSPVYLTASDLYGTIIEIRNGAGSHDLAHQTRSLLSDEGFNVGIIGNHIDFGTATTVIYYRSWAEKVAKALHQEFFPMAKMEQSSHLTPGVSIKVLLGHDLLVRPRLMARLANE